jgi:mono/diheme cytochrome c family protein
MADNRRSFREMRYWTAGSSAAMAVLLMLPAQGATQQFASDVRRDITYSRDVAPIFQESCVSCHQPESIGPMSLTSYEQVRPYAQLIKRKVESRDMPPFQLDTNIGIQEIKGDWRLSKEQIATIAAWVDAGAPQGDPADMPHAKETTDALGWTLADQLGRQPELVVKSTPFDVPAEGGDLWWGPMVPVGNTQERWIQAVQVRPSYPYGRQVVHHADPGIRILDDEGDLQGLGVGLLTEYALGKVGEIFPPDAARRLPPEAIMNWDIHYYPKGFEVKGDQVEIALWLYPEDYDPTHEQTLENFGLQGDIAIPPHGTAMTQGVHILDHPVRIDSWQPHGHYRLHAMSMEAVYPTEGISRDRREVLGMVSNYRATWQHSYIFEDDAAPLLPTGTVILLTAWYDNTENNPLNPDPNEWVGRGSRTNDEMSHAWVAVTHLDEESYAELKAERERKKGNDEVTEVSQTGAN